MLYTLEARILFASLSASLEDGLLTVIGTDLDDVIHVSVEGKKLKVEWVSEETEFKTAVAKVHTIVIRGRLGNDVITIDDRVGVGGQIYGGAGNDKLVGGRRSWLLDGEAGHDRLIGGRGRDAFVGGPGIDTVDYGGRGTELRVTLDGVADDGAVALKSDAKGEPIGEQDNVGIDIENLIGGAGRDLLVGNELRNTLKGGLGNDTIMGGAGDDVLSGDGGADKMFGDEGDDILVAIDGDDRDDLDGGEGYDAAAFDEFILPLPLDPEAPPLPNTRDTLFEIEDELSILFTDLRVPPTPQ